MSRAALPRGNAPSSRAELYLGNLIKTRRVTSG